MKVVFLNWACLLVITFALFSCAGEPDASDDTPVINNEQNQDSAYTSTVNFYSLDSLLVTAEQYHIDKTKPVIILCHQAGSSRGEYKDIAPTLNDLGFNCIALDQRSGNTSQGIDNQTAIRAQAAGKGQTYLDAEQDILAAIDHFSTEYNQNVIIWGSSYSSSLVLKVAASHTKVDQVLSFSPGEYLAGVQVNEVVKSLDKPSFLTSSKSEEAQTKAIFDNIKGMDKTQFVPNGAGRHGSSCLWPTEADHEEYWVAVKSFLGV